MALPEREYDRSLNSEIERLMHQFEVVSMDVRGLISVLDDDQLNWSPGRARWSIGQSIDHLNITSRTWFPFIAEAIADGRKNGKLDNGPFVYGFVSRMFLRVLEPPVKNLKAKAPKGFIPAKKVALEPLLAEFESHHSRAQELLKSANGLDLARIKVQSAFSKRIRYSLGMAFWLMAAHERRHIWQARQVRNNGKFPKTDA